MYLIETYFRLTALENNIESQSRLLNAVIDQWRYNGQIIGREIPLYLAEEDGAQGFAMRVICPEQDSLFPQNNNAEVNRALQEAEKCGVILMVFNLWVMISIQIKQQKIHRQLGKCFTQPIYKVARRFIVEKISHQFRCINS